MKHTKFDLMLTVNIERQILIIFCIVLLGLAMAVSKKIDYFSNYFKVESSTKLDKIKNDAYKGLTDEDIKIIKENKNI